MPDLSTLILFIFASLGLLVAPGPTTALVITRSLSEGRRVALPLVFGVALGGFVAATLALAGAGSLLAASASAFTIVKVAGATYLIWIGIKLFRSEPVVPNADHAPPSSSQWIAFRDGFLVTVFNPKGILFFIAFVPQFIASDRSYFSQSAILVVTFALLEIANGTIYALGADNLRHLIQKTPVIRFMNRLGGGVIVFAGVAAFFTRRPAI